MALIAAHDASLAGVLIALDRQEKGQGELSAIQEVERDFATKVVSIVSLADLIEYLQTQVESQPELADHLANIKQYRVDYGI